MVTQIFDNEGTLNFNEGKLASKEQFQLEDRCVGSIFEALEPGEEVELAEGSFLLDEDLDLIPTSC